MPAPTTRVAVSAGRFDRTIADVLVRLERALKLGALVYLSTEVMRHQREAFRRFAREQGWAVVFRGEYALAWDATRYAPHGLRARLAVLSAALFPRGGPRNLIHAQAAELRLRDKVTGRVTVFTIGHLPAHLDAGGHYSGLAVDHDRVKAHRQALNTLGQRARRRRKAHPDRGQFVGLDTNVNLYREPWRRLLAADLHPLAATWTTGRLPDHGDLGERLVVGAWAYGLVPVDAEVLPSDAGSDHDLVIVDLRDPQAPR